MIYTLYLVRHGEFDNPDGIYPFHLPVTLSHAGRQRLQLVGTWLSRNGKPRTRIFTSPIVRTVQSAEIIAAATGSMVSVDERLVELTSPLQGHPYFADRFGPEYEKIKHETPSSVLARMTAAAADRMAEQQDAIIVSHGDPLTLLYYHLTGRTVPERIWTVEDYVQKGEIIALHYNADQLEVSKRIAL